jgi:hypothetical protein
MVSIVDVLYYKYGKKPSLKEPINANKSMELQFADLMWTTFELPRKYLPKNLPTLKDVLEWEKQLNNTKHLSKISSENIIEVKEVVSTLEEAVSITNKDLKRSRGRPKKMDK